MVCDVFKNKDGQIIWMCGRELEPAIRCSIKDCHAIAEKLCDFPLGQELTCDRKLCKTHAVAIAYEMDYCPTHKAMYDKYIQSGEAEWRLSEVIPLHKQRESNENQQPKSEGE